MNELKRICCSICGGKICDKIREDTVLKNILPVNTNLPAILQ